MSAVKNLLLMSVFAASFASADDWRIIESDRYADKPTMASAAGKTACQPSLHYVELINAGHYDQIASLFATNAVFMPPSGETLRGPQAIGAFYQKFLGQITPRIVPISFIGDGAHCVMELAAKVRGDASADYQLSAIDHFVVDASGKVTQMIVYLRPRQLSHFEPK